MQTDITHTLPVRDISREVGVEPRKISWLLYNRALGKELDAKAPIICGKRRIPREWINIIRAECVKRGWLNS